MEDDIRKRISREPRYGAALYRILGDCLGPIAFGDLESRICSYPEMRVRLYEPATLVSWLVDTGALEVQFEGHETSVAKLSAGGRGDEGIVLVATEAGRRVWTEHEEAGEVARLLEAAGAARRTYLRVLELCRIPQSKRTVEQVLVAEGLLDLKRMQVSYYLDRLEKAGGLVWGKGWTTTQQGLAELA